MRRLPCLWSFPLVVPGCDDTTNTLFCTLTRVSLGKLPQPHFGLVGEIVGDIPLNTRFSDKFGVLDYGGNFTQLRFAFERCMDNTVEVKVLKYQFRFKPVRWREELGIKPDPKLDRRRQILAHALVEISGLKINNISEAARVFTAIPISIIDRIFTVYKGSLTAPRIFKTMGLYKAPNPLKYSRRVEREVREQEDEAFRRAEELLESKYGKEELRETRELEAAILKGSKLRGATRATPDPSDEEI